MIALAWLRDHRRFVAEVLAVALAATLGWHLHRAPAPTVVEHVDDHKASAARADVAQTDARGPEVVTITDYDEHYVGPRGEQPAEKSGANPSFARASENDFCRPVLVPGEDRVLRVTRIERGAETITTHAATEEHATEDRHLELTIAPPARPGWELQLGVEDVLAAREVRLAVRRRFAGDLWIEVSAKPLQRQLGAAVAWAF